ncbi:MAG: choice-of-anchor tandem repeat GloVer-containing protein [Candidatus Sulfotelmatobacter sp.]
MRPSMLPLKSARLIIALAVVLFGATGMGVAQTEATLHRFENKGDGYSPIAGVIADSEGNLYGAASDDFSDSGTIFKMTPPAPGGRWIYSALYKMNGKTDGDTPWASLLRDSSGNLYGTADAGGAHSCGTVFELTPPTASGAPWTFSLLYTFAGGTDGCATEGAGLVADNLGNLYGVTGGGGKCSAGCNEGVVYRLSPPTVAGAAWTETVLYRFGTGGANDSAAPICTLLRMGEALYGTTFAGGVYGAGTVFVLQPPSASGKPWTEQVLYSFTGGTSDGLKPQAGLISDGRGGIYGTTADNYAFVFATCAGTYCGHVFDLNPPSGEGEPWTYTSVWAFSGPDGSTPYAPVARDNSGNLYGTTSYGGSDGGGVVFKLTPPAAGGGTWTETTLYDFGTGVGGQWPQSNVAFGQGGRLYGTAYSGALQCPNGGPNGGCGTVFTLEP